jgi:predicted RNA binding protein YcfA (HicA-like mRNA interferase family)
MSGKELAALLVRHGWTLLRVNGSHHIYGKTGSSVRISLPIHGNTTLKVGLLKHLLKQAGLSQE